MNTPLVSIISSSYNNGRDVGKMIESVLAQTYPHWELIISDDGSSDNSRAVIDSYTDSRIKTFHSMANGGIVKQMNMLFEKAQGDYVTILDADDMFAPEKLALQVAAFQGNPELVLCLGVVAVCDEQDKVIQVADHYPKTHKEIIHFIDTKHAFPCGNMACMMFRRSSLIKHGGYKTYYQGTGGHDLDLVLRIIADGGQVIALPQIVYYWRKHQHSFSRKINMNPLRNQCHQFCYLIYEQIKKYQLDDLTGLNSGALEQLRQKIINDYERDPSRIYREICNSRDLPYSVRFRHGCWAIKLNPFHQKNYRYFIKSLLRI